MFYLCVISWQVDIGLKNHVSDRKTFTIKQKTVGKLLIRNCTPKLLPSGREMNGLAMLLFYNLYQWDSFGMVFIGLIITTFLTVWRNLGVFSSSLPLFSNSHRTLLLEHHILLECLMKNKWQYQALARMWSSWDSPTLLVKMESGTLTPENSIAASYKVKHIFTTWPSNPTPRIYQTEWKFDKWNPCTKQGLLGTRGWGEAMTMKKNRRIFRGDRTLILFASIVTQL